jgi:hypothetical protein
MMNCMGKHLWVSYNKVKRRVCATPLCNRRGTHTVEFADGGHDYETSPLCEDHAKELTHWLRSLRPREWQELAATNKRDGGEFTIKEALTSSRFRFNATLKLMDETKGTKCRKV